MTKELTRNANFGVAVIVAIIVTLRALAATQSINSASDLFARGFKEPAVHSRSA